MSYETRQRHRNTLKGELRRPLFCCNPPSLAHHRHQHRHHHHLCTYYLLLLPPFFSPSSISLSHLFFFSRSSSFDRFYDFIGTPPSSSVRGKRFLWESFTFQMFKDCLPSSCCVVLSKSLKRKSKKKLRQNIRGRRIVFIRMKKKKYQRMTKSS